MNSKKLEKFSVSDLVLQFLFGPLVTLLRISQMRRIKIPRKAVKIEQPDYGYDFITCRPI